MLWLFVRPAGLYLLDIFAPVFSFIYRWVLIFASFLYRDLHVLGDDALISTGSFMQTEYLHGLIHISINGAVGAVKPG